MTIEASVKEYLRQLVISSSLPDKQDLFDIIDYNDAHTKALNNLAQARLFDGLQKDDTSIPAAVHYFVFGGDMKSNSVEIAALEVDIATNAAAIAVAAAISAIDTVGIVTNTASIATNTAAIAAIDTSAVTGLTTRITTAEGDIATNSAAIALKADQTDVDTNTADIATNAADIAAIDLSAVTGLTTRVTAAEGDIATNAAAIAAIDTSGIASNAAAIALKADQTDVDTNAAAIAAIDTSGIATNAAAIAAIDTSGIATNAAAISNLQTPLYTVSFQSCALDKTVDKKKQGSEFLKDLKDLEAQGSSGNIEDTCIAYLLCYINQVEGRETYLGKSQYTCPTFDLTCDGLTSVSNVCSMANSPFNKLCDITSTWVVEKVAEDICSGIV